MSQVKIVAITQPLIEGVKTAEEFISYAARVSNPANQNNTLTAPKLLKYLIKNKHFSPFEMVSITMEINTTRDITHQIVRHRSFSFQEFSQRYADPTKDMGFILSEARLQDQKNRQNSIEVDDNYLHSTWGRLQQKVIDEAKDAYEWAIDQGIAKELARKVLPEGLTNSRLYMSGTLRSWIHYVDVRASQGTQKEHMLIGQEAKEELLRYFPSLAEYWSSEPKEEMIKEEVLDEYFWQRIFKFFGGK